MNFPTPGDGDGDLGCFLDGERVALDGSDFLLEEQVHHLSLDQEPTTACGAFDYSHIEQNQYPAEDYSFWNQDLQSVICELTPEEVRWFYKSDTDKRWTEFNGYDSHQIEFLYRQYNQEWLELQSYTEQQKNGTAEGVGVKIPKHQIVVRGGMYEVDVHNWKGYSIFWPGEEFQVTRGSWFFAANWQPLEYPHCEAIENAHLQLFGGQRLSDYSDNGLSPKEVWHTEQMPEFHVDWHSPKDVYLHNETAPSKLMRSVTQRLGLQKPTGCRLVRGYKTQALSTDEAERITDITHLVFVIHGIGQKMDTGRIIRNSNGFRDCVTGMKRKYFPNSEDRPEFFPVEWRSALKLDGDLVSAITPIHLEKLRSLLNASAMDIMYYTSPLFGQEIQAGLCLELNRLYSMFLERYPNFRENGGKCSVIAHSLGCVIVYDIVTGWLPNDPMACLQRAYNTGSGESQKKSGLSFEIENFFCLGSPLSVFLSLRWKDPHNPENHEKVLPPSLCKRLYNIFHPADPVAYRLEPLLLRAYKTVAPLTLQPYNAGTKIPYDQMSLEPIQTETILTRKIMGDTPDKDDPTPEPASNIPSPPTPSRVADRWNLWSLMSRGRRTVQAEGNHFHESIPKDGSGSPTHHHENVLRGLEHRLDFALRENQLATSYLAALTSHTAYWENYDVAFFILTRLFPKLEQEAQVPTSAEGCEPPSPPEFCG